LENASLLGAKVKEERSASLLKGTYLSGIRLRLSKKFIMLSPSQLREHPVKRYQLDETSVYINFKKTLPH
jgi:hypothetical protein